MEHKAQSKRPLVLFIIFGSLVICGAIVFAVIWAVTYDDDCSSKKTSTSEPLYKSGHGTYKYAAVAADSATCSNIGNDILTRHRGNAVDAAIATILCTGAVQPQSCGIGGGSFIIIYDRKLGWLSVNSRETAPSGATANMYTKEENKGKSQLGGLAIAVPGEVKGLLEIHQRFGYVSWETLVKPTVKLLRDGFEMSEAIHKQVVTRVLKLADKSGFEVFLDNNRQPLPVGSLIKMPKLAQTFQTIAQDPDSFYSGTLAENIVKDIQEREGIIVGDDLKNYKLALKAPTHIKLPNNLTLYSMPPPGSGPVLSYILSILAGYNFNANSVATDEATILTYHRIVEAMKFAYGKRSAFGDEDFVDVKSLVQNLTSRSYGEQTRLRINDSMTQGLGYYDPSFYNIEDSGTSHISVVDAEGNAVSVTSTINTHFGSKVIGSRTGIVFNNEMDDFSTPNVTNYFGFPPSASNFIEPGKRPQSSMTPSIVWDDTERKVRMVVGAAGGSKITTTTAWLIMNVLYFQKSMPEAMDLPRIHHQLMPMEISAEKDLQSVIKSGLKAKGHVIKETDMIAVAHAIDVLKDEIVAVSDFRKGGQPAGY